MILMSDNNCILWIIIGIVLIAAAFVTGYCLARKKYNGKFAGAVKLSNKHLALYLLMDQWVRVKQDGISLSEYLKKKGYTKIAIYGMNYVGETLLSELEGTGVSVAYAIDKNAANIYSSIPVQSPRDKLEKVDAIVVTPVTAFESIYEEMTKIVDIPVISIEDLLYELY